MDSLTKARKNDGPDLFVNRGFPLEVFPGLVGVLARADFFFVHDLIFRCSPCEPLVLSSPGWQLFLLPRNATSNGTRLAELAGFVKVVFVFAAARQFLLSVCVLRHGCGMTNLIWALMSRNEDDETAVRGFLLPAGILRALSLCPNRSSSQRASEAV